MANSTLLRTIPSTTYQLFSVDFNKINLSYVDALVYLTCLNTIWETFFFNPIIRFDEFLQEFPGDRETISFPIKARMELHIFDKKILSNFPKNEIDIIIEWSIKIEGNFNGGPGYIDAMRSLNSHPVALAHFNSTFDLVSTDLMKSHSLINI
jgi:hypothetical protein